ncbi:MAG: FtsX-like permease family protein [Lachnospiraceae bacterium]|nr:FtsX-like permease family protein [Lachnospiraceae bacterium]
MRISEILRLVWLNLVQNKSKVILTSIGIVAGSATIMMVLAIGRGGQMEVAEQFKNLNAGAVDVTYESSGGDGWGGPGGYWGFGFGRHGRDRNEVTLKESDMEDIALFVPGLSDVTISFSTNADVEGGTLDAASSYTIAGVKSNYADLSNLTLAIGDFLTEEDEEGKDKVCVLGSRAAKEIFGSAYDAYDGTVYIDSRPYNVVGVIGEMGTVASGISPDEAIFIPYATGIKYLTGSDVSPTLTAIAEDVDNVQIIKEYIADTLAGTYPNAEFEISDAGSKMEAASKSNETLQLLLIAMASIVFFVGGIGIMNVLFVSVKERTNEIGILKAIGCSRKDILTEFLLEAACISLVGAILGVLFGLCITPIIESFSVRVELTVSGAILSLLFGVLTGSLFGFYPAYKASTLIPVVALNQE